MQEKRQLQVKLENLEQVLKVGRLHDHPSARNNGVGRDGGDDYFPRGSENLSKTEDSRGHIDSVSGVNVTVEDHVSGSHPDCVFYL